MIDATPQKTLLQLLLCFLFSRSYYSDASIGVVTAFVTTSPQSAVGRGEITLRRLISIGQEAIPSEVSSSSRSLLSLSTTSLQKVDENVSEIRYSLRPTLPSYISTTTLLAASLQSTENNDETKQPIGTNKNNFFASLDTLENINKATSNRSALLEKMINEKKIVSVNNDPKITPSSSSSSTTVVPTISYENPGSTQTFLSSSVNDKEKLIAEGKWKVVYAPHISTAMDIFRGKFDVTYNLFADSKIVSHAYYDFPIVGKGYLSVSGTYGTVADDTTKTYSRVDFNKAWIKMLPSSSSSSSSSTTTEVPYESLDDVPDSFLKTIINEIGKRAFIESVAVFPVSFLDDDTIVFEFEFLGTKICAHKV